MHVVVSSSVSAPYGAMLLEDLGFHCLEYATVSVVCFQSSSGWLAVFSYTSERFCLAAQAWRFVP